MTIILTANGVYEASLNKNNRIFFFKFDIDTLTTTATRGKIYLQFVNNEAKSDSWSKILYEFFCLYDPKKSLTELFRFFYFHHSMQIAYKILSYCIYKCNLHLQLVVEKMGNIYNKSKLEQHGGD